tara:strand:- start:2704 stop:2961 length:258 start_codon:yes stop_codon:yes gene_type:complete
MREMKSQNIEECNMKDLRYGNCQECKFRKSIWKDHYQKDNYEYFCERFPPKPASNANGDGPFNHQTVVSKREGCWEFQPGDERGS